MKPFSLLVLIGFMFFLFSPFLLNGQTKISIKVPRKTAIIFNYVDSFQSAQLQFSNPGTEDSLIVRSISVSLPTHLFYSNLIIKEINKPEVHNFGSLLVFPGDSLSIDWRLLRFTYSNGYNAFIDSLLAIHAAYMTTDVREFLGKNGLEKTLRQIEATYRHNMARIHSLSSLYDGKYLKGLEEFSFIIKCKEICKIPYQSINYSVRERKLLDSCYQMIGKNLQQITSINTPYSYGVISELTNYYGLKRGANSENLLEKFDLLDRKILLSNAYSSFLLYYLNNNFDGNYENLQKEVELIRKAGITDERFESLIHHKRPTMSLKMDTVLLNLPIITPVGNISKIKDVLVRDKVIYLDLWASWCIPCLYEIPFLKKQSTFLNEMNIIYVGISIDENRKAWTTAIKNNGLQSTRQYLINPESRKILQRILKVETIPRYLLLAFPDKIINPNAPRPSDSLLLRREINLIRSDPESLE